MKEKAIAIWITPLRLFLYDLREVYIFTKGLFR